MARLLVGAGVLRLETMQIETERTKNLPFVRTGDDIERAGR
ncbi:hypothetical protein [Bradyrhizobium sp. NC92]|nr:hypothetical protein [Bradyrhizobium sp. NC92]UWU67874.1 hypothetical protein N2602_32475 [Bradyrhizobium sp. NC92]